MKLPDFERAYGEALARGATHVVAITGGSIRFTKGDDVPLVTVDAGGKITLADETGLPRGYDDRILSVN